MYVNQILYNQINSLKVLQLFDTLEIINVQDGCRGRRTMHKRFQVVETHIFTTFMDRKWLH